MKHRLVALLVCTIATTPATAADHPCAQDAKQRAENLLRFHFVLEAGEPITKLDSAEVLNMAIDDKVTVLKPIKAPVGKGKFDVLQVQGSIYKADYRVRMINAQNQGSCDLMGQEILELSDPY